MYDDDEDEFLLDVSLDANGNEVIATDPGDILRVVTVDAPTPFFDNPDIYDTTIRTLTDAGYVEGEDLFVFPYDWRKDTEGQGKNELLAKINEIRNDTGTPRVDIMAHSQGGLVTLAALRDTKSIGKVRKVVTLGTPLLGSPKSLGLLEYKLGCFGSSIPFKGCAINSDVTQEIMRFMPGTYQLLPSRKYDEAVGAPLSAAINGITSDEIFYDQWTAEVLQGSTVDSTLLSQAGAFHRRYDFMAWADPSVDMVRIVGTGHATPTSILEYTYCDYFSFHCETHNKYNEGAGDGTVPDGSAAPGALYDLIDRTETVYAPGIEHGELAVDSNVLGRVILFFRPSPQHPQSRSFGTSLSETPQSFNGTELEVTGPARGYVGNEANINASNSADGVTQDLPGGSYNAASGHQSFFLNDDGSYVSEFEVLERGSVQLEIQDYAQSQASREAVFRVREPIGARLRLQFTTGQDPSSIRLGIDQEGNGTIDREASPVSTVTGAAAGEAAPPNTAISLEDTDGQVRVGLSAEDGAEGSGVADTYYMLEGDTKSRLYKEPFAVSPDTTVRFLSVDEAGNTERTQRVVANGAP